MYMNYTSLKTKAYRKSCTAQDTFWLIAGLVNCVCRYTVVMEMYFELDAKALSTDLARHGWEREGSASSWPPV